MINEEMSFIEKKPTSFIFGDDNRELFKIVPIEGKENTWDIILADDVTLTDAAQMFWDTVKALSLDERNKNI